MLRRSAALAALLLSSTASVCAAQAAPARSAPASQQSSEWMKGAGLKADPELRIGMLPNGMRYVIRPNKTPPGVASVRLRIDTGSLNEAEDQRGLAHFLEHMVLNGTDNVPEGEFVKRLERHGLRFGPDTNASTDFSQTVFKLELPQTKKETVEEAIYLLREVAGRAKLETKAIDGERGIILSEERVRANAGLRQLTDELNWMFPGQLLPNRLPIGTVDVISKAPRERLLDYYQAWYRPERATLIVVGDVDPAATEALIARQFGDWRGKGAAGVPADGGQIKPRMLDGSVFVDPAIAAMVRIAWIKPADREPDSITRRVRELDEQFAAAILNRRLAKLAQAEGTPPYVSASAGTAEFDETGEVTSLSAVAHLGNWRKALSTLEQEQRRLVTFGVTPDELEREMTGARTAIQAGAAAASTRASAGLAEQLVGAVNRDAVVTSPADRLSFFEAAAKDITPAKIDAAAKRLFSGSGPLLYLTLPRAPADIKQALLDQFATSQKVAVTVPAAQTRIAWPYEKFGIPGTVVDRREMPSVGATTVRFANGVRLTVRPSQSRKEQVLVQASFGNGRLAMDPASRSPEWALGSALAFGGTRLLDSDSLNRSLTGKLVGAGFDVQDERFALAGATRPADFSTQMQLLAAYLTDAGWRPIGWDRAKSTAGMIHDRYENTPGGVLQRDSGLLLHSGDKRWELPSRSQMRMSNIAEGRALLEPALKNGPIEVVVAGDITVDRAIAETAATFGALPPRSGTPAPVGTMRFPAPPAEPVVLYHKGREDQAVGFIAWPTTGYSKETRQLARTLSLLGSVFQLRLTERLREAEGVSYSPNAAAAASPTWTDYGFLAAQIEAPPAKLDAFFKEAQEIATALATKPVDEDELNRARRPVMAAIERSRDGNGFWVGALAEAADDPFKLESILTQASDVQAITPVALQAAARRFLVPATAYRIKVVKGAMPAITPPVTLPTIPVATTAKR